MIDPNLITFAWNAVVGGVVGNAAYDSIKTMLGKGFDRLSSYAQEDKEREFQIALLSILETNEKIEKELSQLREGQTNVQQQNHNGIGDNVGRDKIININPTSAPSQKVKYDLTDKHKETLRKLVNLGRSWRDEFEIVWHTPDISDILYYDGNPPHVSKGDLRVLASQDLLICDFLENKASVVLTRKSYSAVDTDFAETI